MKTNSRKVECIETCEVFGSCREADREFGLKNGETWQMAANSDKETYRNKKYGLHFRFIEVEAEEVPAFDSDVVAFVYGSDKFCIPTPDADEIFKEIPEYPTYSISNFGRVRQNSTGHIKSAVKTVRKDNVYYYVMLQLNRRPHFCSLRNLYRSAWLGEPLPVRFNTKGCAKTISCKTDNKEFSSYTECVECYGFDYQQFREALHSAEGNEFEFDGKVFSLI